MTALLICCFASGCWLGTDVALDHYSHIYPERWLTNAAASLADLLGGPR